MILYDLIIIGGGAGGFAASGIARGLGKRVAIIEKNKLGGDCTWYGCVPSKTLIKAAEVAHLSRNTAKYGIRGGTGNQFDTSQVMTHVRHIIADIYAGETPEVLREKGIDVYLGSPTFTGPQEIQVDGVPLRGKRIIISTGSHAFIPAIDGLDTIPYLTNESLFDLEKLPQSMIVLGGGPIGTEMASALNRLGVQVTQIEVSDRILTRDEPELVETLMASLRAEGLNILTGHRAIRAAARNGGVAITVEDAGKNRRIIEAEALLVAVGRRPNVDGMNLEKAGVAYSERGIEVNEKLQTSNPAVYAIGDVIGGYQFSHIAEYHATVAVPNALLPLPIKKKVDYRNMVWCTFTQPELAHGGLTEQQARERYGDSIRIYRHHYRHVDRARTDVAETGSSKFITDRTGKLLGIHILGNRAAELLHEAQLAKTLGRNFAEISGMIHIYPTYGDLVKRPADQCFVDNLQNKFYVKIAKKLFSGKSAARPAEIVPSGSEV